MTEHKERKEGGLFGALRDGMQKVATGFSDPSSLQHTLRQQVATYNPKQSQETLRLQLAIKSAGGVVMDEQALAREQAMYSKNLFLWGKDEKGADMVDFTDRLAFLLFKTSEVQKQHAERLEQSRVALKDIRNFENELIPRRKQRETLALKIGSTKNAEEVTRMKSELQDLDQSNATFEASLEQLRRTKLHESFQLHFSAQREFAEKSAIIAGYGELLLRGMETDGFGDQYQGHEKTARVKGELGEALEAWSSSHPLIPSPELKHGGSSYLGRADTQSFGSTHANELSQLHDDDGSSSRLPPMPSASSAPTTHAMPPSPVRVLAPIPAGKAADHTSPPLAPVTEGSRPVPFPPQSSSGSGSGVPLSRVTSPPDVAGINLSPTPRDLGAAYSPSTSPLPAEPLEPLDLHSVPAGPTVAETGVPIVGTGGPSSGSLASRPHPTSAEEKSRLEQEQVQRASAGIVGGNEELPTYTDGLGGQEDPRARADAEAQQILAAERERKAGGGIV